MRGCRLPECLPCLSPRSRVRRRTASRSPAPSGVRRQSRSSRAETSRQPPSPAAREGDLVVGHRGGPRVRLCLDNPTLPSITAVTTAAEKSPAYARLSAVAPAATYPPLLLRRPARRPHQPSRGRRATWPPHAAACDVVASPHERRPCPPMVAQPGPSRLQNPVGWSTVLPGLDPGTHGVELVSSSSVGTVCERRARRWPWIPGSSPGMTML